MEVVLLERVEKLGKMGDVVKVKDGYARNYLLPKKKALRATKTNIERFERERASLETQSQEAKGTAEAVAAKLEGHSFIVLRQAGESGQLYGSVNTRNIADAINEAGFSVTRGDVVLDRPIKALGLHPLAVALHPEVRVNVTINVARSAEEAARQARGEIITGGPEAAEAALALEALFEDETAAARVQGEEAPEAESPPEGETLPPEGEMP
jgi:large subunit ribosomal protein L9